MTITTTTSRWVYTGDAISTAFGFDNRIFAASDMQVFVDGVRQTSGYTVSGVDQPAGGTVTFAVAPAVGAVVILNRKVPATQTTAYPANDPFPADAHERALDKLTVQDQQILADQARTLRRPPTSTSTASLDLPDPVPGRALKFAADGALIVSDLDPDAVAASAAADAAAAATARSAAEAARDTAVEAAGTSAAEAVAAAEEALENQVALAQSAASMAETARDITFDLIDHFDARYLGPKESDPLVDNDGDPLVGGALYFRTSDPPGMRVYTGAAWVAAYVDGQSALGIIPTTVIASAMVVSSLNFGTCIASPAKEVKLNSPTVGDVGAWVLIVNTHASANVTIAKASSATVISAHGLSPFALPPGGAAWGRVVAAGVWLVEGSGLAAAAITALQASDARNQRAARITFNSISR